jgi:hypothetical protein
VFDRARSLGNVLVLEDDYVDEDRTYNRETTAHIQKYLASEESEECDMLMLGAFPFILSPIGNFPRVFASIGTHAAIYTPRGRSRMLELASYEVAHATLNDFDMITTIYMRRVLYHRPLYAQSFSETTNTANWHNGVVGLGFPLSLTRVAVGVVRAFMSYMQVTEARVTPSHFIWPYAIAKCMTGVIFFLLLFVGLVLIYVAITVIGRFARTRT